MPLTRRFTPFGMLLLSLNGMIGSAWLFAPLYAAKIAGAAAVVAWVLGGFATILVALTFAELSTFLPVAGGTSRFSQLSHGSFTGFMISWASWLSCVTMPPIEVQAVLQYSANYFPSLTHLVNGSHQLSYLGMFWACIIMVTLCIINIASFKGLVRFNYIIFAFKVAVIVLTILLLIHTQFYLQNFSGVFHISTLNSWHTILAAVATGGVAFAFTGFKHGVEMAGEVKNSQITIPLAIVGSVIICLVLYLGLQIAFIGAINPKAILNGWHNLSFTGDAGPFAGLAILLGLALLAKLLYIDAAVSPLGAGLVYVTTTARLVYAMSKNTYLPNFLSKLSFNNFPVYAIIFNFLVGMLLFLPFPGWQSMVSFLVSAVIISYAMGPIALICLRRQLPQEPRPFRLPFAEFLCLVAFYFCNLMSYWVGWDTMWKLAIALIVGLVLYALNYLRSKQWQQNNGVKSIFWLLPYLTGLIMISFLGTYGGGKNIIPFGWDFLVIGLFTIVIFYLAIWVRAGSVLKQFRQYQSAELQNLEEN